MEKEKVNCLFRVPNNEEGRVFMALAKKYLNKDSYLLKQRGRTPNDKKLKKDKKSRRYLNLRQSVPLKYADNIGVYLLGKHNGQVQTIGISTIELYEYYRKLYYENHRSSTDVIKARLKMVQDDINSIIEL